MQTRSIGRVRQAGAWLIVGLVAVYLELAMASHAIAGVPLPVLGIVLAPAVLVGMAFVRARIERAGILVRPGPVEAMAGVALVGVLLTDAVLFESPALRDLALYVRAGWFANYGLPVYLASPMTYLPNDPTLLPFLYPPFTLPFFGALARLPWPLVATVWTTLSVAAALAALRLFGLSWRWSALFLLWPPFAEGLYVGNVAVPAVLLFALGLRRGGTLALGAIFKFQAGIPALWLLRERRGRELLGSVTVLLALVVGTLPIVGFRRWSEWLNGLLSFQASEQRFPALSGQSLTAFLPAAAVAVIGVIAILVALRWRGREGLARMGIAAIVASPSLYSHGFLVGLPAFLALNRFWFWTAMGFTASVWGYGWWAALGIAVAAWRVPAMTHRAIPSEELHPLQGAIGPWRRPLGWGGVPVGRPVDAKLPSDA